jgi:hypothetical protein
MRNIRMVGGLAAAICVLAVTAAPTMAHQFVSSKLGKTTGRGFNEIPVEKGVQPEFNKERMQEWRLGTSFRILCYKTKMAGEVTETESETCTSTLKFSGCGWYPQLSLNHLHVAAKWSPSGLTIVYHANGWTEAVGNGTGEVYEFKNAELRETAAYINISSTKICKIVIPQQTIPVRAIKHPEEEFSAALFTDIEVPAPKNKTFPLGKQERVLIANEFKNLKFKYTGTETQCSTGAEFEKQAEEGGGGIAGAYLGTLETWVPGGNLKWE